jgi:hypothetical protein
LKHETQSAEKLALGWHLFGVVASTWWTLGAILFIHQFWALLRVDGFLGAIISFYIWGAVLSAACSGAGIWWHAFACLEHKSKLKGKRRG